MCRHVVNFHTHQSTDEKRTTDEIFPRNNFNPVNAELNPTCQFLALLGAHHILHVSRMRVKFHRATSVPKPSWYKVQTLVQDVTFSRPSC